MEITRWRLEQELVVQNVEATLAGLNALLAEGFVTQEVRLGTERIFHLNEDRRAAAEDLLREGSG